MGCFGLVAVDELVCTTEVAVGMEQLPGMWGTRQEKCSSCGMLTGKKCEGTCRSPRYLFVFQWQPAYRFKYGSAASTMEAPRKCQGSPRSQPTALPEGGNTPQRSRAVSWSDSKALSCQASLSFQTVGMRQDWWKAEAGMGLPSHFLRRTKKSLSVANCAGCLLSEACLNVRYWKIRKSSA